MKKWYRIIWHSNGLHWVYECKRCTPDEIKECVEYYNEHDLYAIYTFEEC